MIRFSTESRWTALVLFLLIAGANVASAGQPVLFQNELDRLRDIERRIEALPAYRASEELKQQISELRMKIEQQERKPSAVEQAILRSQLNKLERQLGEAQKAIVNFRQAVSRENNQLLFPSVRNRLAAFTFDDPHATGLGDPISFLLSKKLLFSARVTSFAVVNYRQGTDRDPSTNVAYFDQVDALVRDQKFLLAIWGRISRTDRGIRIESFLQVPDDADKDKYVRNIRLPMAMGGSMLKARLKPERILLQRLDFSAVETTMLRTAAEQVATLRVSPAPSAPVTGHLSDGTDPRGPVHRIVDSEGDWVQLELSDGTSGWTSVDEFCTGPCRVLLDVANFTTDMIALQSGLAAKPVAKSLTFEAEGMSQQMTALLSLPDNPNIAQRVAEGWVGRDSGFGRTGFSNLFAVASIQMELKRRREVSFDQIQLPRQTIEPIVQLLADASVEDPGDIDVVENLAALFAYLGDNRRRDLALEIAADLKNNRR
jgi:hypothetical protein